VLIHGGLANRTFWAPQLEGLAGSFRVVALDLAGHGQSGRNRASWTLGAFGEDVRAVANAEGLGRIALVGNSLGGPVALEAARLLSGRARGVIGVDAFHNLAMRLDEAFARQQADLFRVDFANACRTMVNGLFHPGREDELRAFALKIMLAMPPDVVVAMMNGLAGFDQAAVARAAGVPVRAICGDLWPVGLELNRGIVPDFDVVVMEGAGHYPMLERPEEFNRHLAAMAAALQRP
jgi:pimeloyl-ACP methyl ester carboxylesterase